MLQYFFESRVHHGIVRVTLGPLFIVSRYHLRLMWQELAQLARAADCRWAIVERSGRFYDPRVDAAGRSTDLLCGLDVDGLRAAFCLYGAACEQYAAEFAAVAAGLGGTLRRFAQLDDAIAWAETAVTGGAAAAARSGAYSERVGTLSLP